MATSRFGAGDRRGLCDVFFKRLFVGPHGIAAAELTDEFGALLADDLATKLEKLPSNTKRFVLGVRTWRLYWS